MSKNSSNQQRQGESSSIKIPPYHYIHVNDRNTNQTRVEIGPQVFIRQDHEQVTTGAQPLKMVILPKRSFCIVENPVLRSKAGQPMVDKHGQFQVQHGEIEIRFQEQNPSPFPLYPREILKREPAQLQVVKDGSALKIEAQRNFEQDGKKILAGDQYLFVGPLTYYPRVEEIIIEERDSTIITPGYALKLKAMQELVDANGIDRKTGDEWLIRKSGAYLPQVHEELVGMVEPIIFDQLKAIQLRATKNFTDSRGTERKAGDEYLLSLKITPSHIVDIDEEIIQEVELTVLTSEQYCIILNPVSEETFKNRLGASVLVQGPISFFLQPGEELDDGIKDAYILSEEEALLLKAKENVEFTEVVRTGDQMTSVVHQYFAGNKWMVHGPCKYIPPIEVEVVENRARIALDKNEGIYIRDTKTGQVRSVIGEAYMLKSHEELWEMELSANIEKLIRPSLFQSEYIREKHKLVSFRAPFNTAVQVYDFKRKTSRIAFGPDLVTLEADEVFTQNALSGSTPKRPGVIETLAINLGPEFTTDEITVETSDHAVLKLLLAYNWQFAVDFTDEKSIQRIFNVKDFIGDMCNLMASKVRSAVASSDFDTFHKTSARLIRKAIFGLDSENRINKTFLMDKNNLMITNVDIKQVEPVDAQTRQSLQKTVSLAIEISTKKQEAAATHQSDQSTQRATGELDELRIKDQLKAEEAQQQLLQMKNRSKEVETQGVAKAEASAQAKAQQITAETNLEVSRSKAQARRIESEAQMTIKKTMYEQVLKHDEMQAELEINRARILAEVESGKFEEMINVIGRETMVALANAGPEAQAELLKGLGLQGYIFTDGDNPINLFSGAQGLLGQK